MAEPYFVTFARRKTSPPAPVADRIYFIKADADVYAQMFIVGVNGELVQVGSPAPELAWNNITGKPDTFPPSAHTHAGLSVGAAEEATVRALGTEATQAAPGNHTHAGLSVEAAATPSVRALGTGATEAAPGNHTHTGLSVQAAATPSVRALGTGNTDAAPGATFSKGADGSGSNSTGTATIIYSQIPTGNAVAGAVELHSTVVGSSGPTAQPTVRVFRAAGERFTYYRPSNGSTFFEITGPNEQPGAFGGGNTQFRIASVGGHGLLANANGDIVLLRSNTVMGMVHSGGLRVPNLGYFEFSGSAWTTGAGTALPAANYRLQQASATLVQLNNGTLSSVSSNTGRDLQFRNFICDPYAGSQLGATGDKLAFLGATPITRQLLPITATASDIATALATLGLTRLE